MSRRTSLDKPGRDGTDCKKSRPIPWQDFELVPLSLCSKMLHCPVPLETLILTQSGSSKCQTTSTTDYVISFLLLFIFELTLKKIIKHYLRAKPKLELMENQAGFMTGTTKSQINLSAKQRRDAANVVIKLPR